MGRVCQERFPRVVLDSKGKEQGVVTGGVRPCTLEGCGGVRIRVRWPDGKVTWPCSAGMVEAEPGVWKIV